MTEVAVMLGYGSTETKFLVLSGQIRWGNDGGSRRILPEQVPQPLSGFRSPGPGTAHGWSAEEALRFWSQPAAKAISRMRRMSSSWSWDAPR